MIVGTIFGWVAASRISNSDGTLYSLNFATFSGLFLPELLAIMIPIFVTVTVFLEFRTDGNLPLSIATFTILGLIPMKTFHACLNSIRGKEKISKTLGIWKKIPGQLGLPDLDRGIGNVLWQGNTSSR